MKKQEYITEIIKAYENKYNDHNTIDLISLQLKYETLKVKELQIIYNKVKKYL